MVAHRLHWERVEVPSVHQHAPPIQHRRQEPQDRHSRAHVFCHRALRVHLHLPGGEVGGGAEEGEAEVLDVARAKALPDEAHEVVPAKNGHQRQSDVRDEVAHRGHLLRVAPHALQHGLAAAVNGVQCSHVGALRCTPNGVDGNARGLQRADGSEMSEPAVASPRQHHPYAAPCQVARHALHVCLYPRLDVVVPHDIRPELPPPASA
mmetsp:Transcript_38073/g.82771  ORF Transcript_38073/g.82771 Transcript_38073/m.82771 type:complete len:207 (+) Transcript_38073:514-1134(+)